MKSTYMNSPCHCPWPWGGGSGVVKKILVDEKYLHEQSLSLPMTWDGSWSIKKNPSRWKVLTWAVLVLAHDLGWARQVEDDQLGLVALGHNGLVQLHRRVHAPYVRVLTGDTNRGGYWVRCVQSTVYTTLNRFFTNSGELLLSHAEKRYFYIGYFHKKCQVNKLNADG